MTSLDENVNDLISILTKIPGICKKFKDNPTEENGEKIVEIIEVSEKKLLTIRQDIVTMITGVKEEALDVEVIPSNNGFIIKNDRE